MSDDISQSIPQRSIGEEIAENRRIYEVSDELHRRCQLYEAQLRDGKECVSRFEVEQRVAEQYAKENGIWIPIHEVFDLGIPGPSGNKLDEGRYANKNYEVWDLVPRNVLKDSSGDIFIIDAEIRLLK